MQKKFAINDEQLAHRMYEYDPTNRLGDGEIDNAATAEIFDSAKKTMKAQGAFSANQLFNFSLLKKAR